MTTDRTNDKLETRKPKKLPDGRDEFFLPPWQKLGVSTVRPERQTERRVSK